MTAGEVERKSEDPLMSGWHRGGDRMPNMFSEKQIVGFWHYTWRPSSQKSYFCSVIVFKMKVEDSGFQ